MTIKPNTPTLRLVELAKSMEQRLRTHPDRRTTRFALDLIEAELFERASRAACELGVIREYIK